MRVYLLFWICLITVCCARRKSRRRYPPWIGKTPRATHANIRRAGWRINKMMMDINKALSNKQGQNVCFSPASVYAALSMAYISSKPRKDFKSTDPLAKALHMEYPFKHTKRYTKWVQKVIKSAGMSNETTFFSADHLWLSDQCEYRKSFIEDAVKLFNRPAKDLLATMPFTSAPENAIKHINKWCEDHTRGKIKDVITADHVNRETVFVITNALYFKGAWESPFDSDRTFHGFFNKEDGTDVLVHMMSKKLMVDYASTTFFDMIELFYKGRQFSMLIFLPKHGYKLDDIFGMYKQGKGKITAKFLSKGLRAKMKSTSLTVIMPKFKMESLLNARDLGNVAEALSGGLPMPAAVDGDCASRALLQDMATKTVIEVDEEGTEAAAFTYMIGGRSIGSSFRVDKPFAFAIFHSRTKTALFFGKVYEPFGFRPNPRK